LFLDPQGRGRSKDENDERHLAGDEAEGRSSGPDLHLPRRFEEGPMGIKDILKTKDSNLTMDELETILKDPVVNEPGSKEASPPAGQAEARTTPSEEKKPAEAALEPKRVEEDVILNAAPAPLAPPRPRKENQGLFEGPIGLDVGTTNIIVALREDKNFKISRQLNAFVTFPASSLTRDALLKEDILFFEAGQKLYILGHSAEDFADILGTAVRQPIEAGILNPKEAESESVIKSFVDRLLRPPKKRGEKVCYSIPGKPLEGNGSGLVYHESILKAQLSNLGYTPVAINEGAAVAISELSANNYTGIGISVGGGMCNVCFSYLAVPVVSYSLLKGGDTIDAMAARSIGESTLRVKRVKERQLNLSASPKDRIESALHIYYEDLFRTLAASLQKALGTTDSLPRLSKPIPIALSGGTVMPAGSREMFQWAMKDVKLPFRVSEVTVAKYPLYATAKGALIQALLEE